MNTKFGQKFMHVLIAMLFLFGTLLNGVTPVSAASVVSAAATASNLAPTVGQTITVTVNIDMSSSGGQALGSYTSTLHWNPSVLTYVSHVDAASAGFTGAVNTTNASTGTIVFNGANPTGATGNTNVLVVTFNVTGSGNAGLDLSFSAMSTIVPTTDLLPILSKTASAVSAFQPVTLEGSASKNTANPNATSISITHTTGSGQNRLMLVGVSWNCGTTDRTISSVVFDPTGVNLPLSLVKTQQYNYSTNNYRYTAIYSLLAPPTGVTGSVVINFSGAVANGIIAGVANFQGVNQSNPLGTPGGAVGTGTTPSTAANPTVALTGLTGNELVFDSVFIGASSSSQTLVAVSPQSEIWNVLGYGLATNFNARGAASTQQATSGSVTMSWTAAGYTSTANRWAIAAVPINPAAGGTTYQLTIAANPSGGGTTSPTVGAHTYAENSVVDITATPNTGYTFSNWTGDCIGTNPNACQVTMNGPKTVNANFTAQTYTLTANMTGSGSITKNPDQANYSYGASVQVSAVPAPGWMFGSWSGDLTGTANPQSITMDGNKTVTASFTQMLPGVVYPDGPVVSGTMVSGSVKDLSVTTGSGQNRLMLVGVSYNSSSTGSDGSHPYVSSVTFTPTSGSPITLDLVIQKWAPPSGSLETGRMAAIYVLNPTSNPAAGTAGTLTVTFSTSFTTGAVIGVANFQGVNQTTPLGTANGAATGNASTDLGVNVDVTTTGNELVFDNVFAGGSSAFTMAVGSGQSALWNFPLTQNMEGGASTKSASAGTTNMAWTRSANGYMALVAVPINPIVPNHTVTFNANNGTGTMSPQTTNVPTALTLNTFTRVGYNFSGWNTLSGGGGTPYADGATYSFAADITLYAQWVPLGDHTVTFNANNGTGTMSPQTTNVPTALTLNTFTRVGYSFSGWNTAANGSGTAYANGATYSFAADITMYAQWSPIPAGAVSLDGVVDSNKADANSSTISITHTTGSGDNRLMLVGVSWNCGNTNTDRTISSIVFDPSGVNLSLNLVKTQQYTWGSGSSTSYRYTAIYSLLNPPKGISGSVVINFSGAVANGIIAGVANFQGVNQSNPLGTPGGAVGTGSTSSGTPNPSVTLTGLGGTELVFDSVFIGASATTQTMVADGGQSELWNVLGYSSSSTSFNARGAASTKQATSSSATMSWTTGGYGTTATRWAIAAVPINPAGGGTTYELNITANPSGGGTTNPTVGAHIYAENTVVNITATPNAGYIFSNWTGGCSGTDPNTCQVTMNGAKTVTANFTALTYTVSFDANGGTTASPASNSVTFGSTYGTLATTSRTGYTLAGWFTAASGGTQVTSASNVTTASDHTLYAQWTGNTYTVTFNANGGTTPSPASKDVTFGSTYGTLASTSQTGYNLTGWFTAASGGTQVTSATTVTTASNHTLYAQWSPIPANAVSLDGSPVHNAANSGSTVSVDVTTGSGQNRLMLVGVSYNSSNTGSAGNRPKINSVTFTPTSGSPITLDLVKQQWSPSSDASDSGRMSAIFVLNPANNPAPGTAGTVTVTFSATFTTGSVVGVANFQGVNQATPLGTAVSNATSNDVATVNVDVSTTGNELVFSNLFAGGQSTSPQWTISVPAGQSELWNNSLIGNVEGGGSTQVASVGTTTMTWDRSNSGYMAIVAVPINPTGGGTTYELNITANPSGGGTTVPGVGTHIYPENNVVNITATPNAGYTFANWGGACSGTDPNTCQVTMNGAKTVTANFTALTYTLTANTSGSGSITKNPNTSTYSYGTVVELTAVPATGWMFDSWSGALTGTTNPQSITMDGNKTVTATFTQMQADRVYLDGVVSSNSVASGTSLSFSHKTGAGSNRFMLVGVSWNPGSSTSALISSVKFSYGDPAVDLAFSEVLTQSVTASGSATGVRYAAIYRSTGQPPQNTTGTVTITFADSVSNGVVAGAANFQNVNQSTPLGTAAGAFASTASTSPSLTLSDLAGNELVFDTVFLGASSSSYDLTPDAGQTQRWNGFISNTRGVASTEQAASPVTMSWTPTTQNWWAQVAVPIRPVGGVVPNHTVIFNSNGGSGSMSNQVANTPTALTLNTFTRTGYSFSNWNTAANGSGTSYANGATYDFSADVTLYAQWSALPTHTVIFDANGGTGSMSNQVANVPTALTSNAFTRTGYSFSNWNTAANGSGTSYANSATYDFSADVTLYAQWTALANHTVNFNSNGGSGSMSNQVANVPTALTLNTFTRAGYSFSGWNTDSGGGGTAYADGATYNFTADVTLYAQWTALPTHTVTFNSNGGSGSMSNQIANIPTSLALNTFTRAGYSFSGWNTDSGGGGTAYSDGATYSFAADVTLYAQWTALPNHTVTFDANGGSGSMSPQTTNKPTALTLNSFTRTGYNFAGWNTASGGSGTAYADGETYSFAADITLYAQWSEVGTPHTITFDANGGSGTMTAQTSSAPAAIKANTFTRDGFTFTGWNSDANGSGIAYADGATYNFAADITLYAQWTGVNHTVTFNANQGTGSMPPQTANTPTALTLNSFTRTGYNFAGWNTAANGSGTAYADGQTYTFAADITLYAQWSQVGTPHTITFNANGGSGTMTAQTASAPAAIKTNTFTRTGFTFTGWNSVANGSGIAYADGATYNFAADITLYAQWTSLNQAPVLNPIGNKSLNLGQSLIFIASATDDGLPSGTLTYNLEAGTSGSVPSGASINAGNGVFSWTPSAAGDFKFDVCVSDGALKDCETIIVSVIPLTPPTHYLYLPLIMK